MLLIAFSSNNCRSSEKAVPSRTQKQTSNGNESNSQLSAEPARTIPAYLEGLLNTQLKRKSNENTSEVIDNGISNLDIWDRLQLLLLINHKHNNADRIAKLKIYSKQRTNKINLVESTLNGDFSLKNLKTNISNDSTAFYNINKIFMKTTQNHYQILRIEEILNPYLKLSYLLRKKEYCLLHGEENVKEIIQFHGTKKSKIEKIVNDNFNWRLHGKAKGNIYGKGVSFTPISNYASNYCDKTEEKCMLAVNVLKSFSCKGNKSTIIPPILNAAINLHYDTTEKPNGDVCVKFRDDEFYPQYLIYFVGAPIKKKIHR